MSDDCCPDSTVMDGVTLIRNCRYGGTCGASCFTKIWPDCWWRKQNMKGDSGQ